MKKKYLYRRLEDSGFITAVAIGGLFGYCVTIILSLVALFKSLPGGG